MKSLWVIGLVGAIGIWSGLVHLATRQDPIFGDWNNHEPKWVALDILVGAVLLICAICAGISLAMITFALKRFRDRDSDK
jgi:hypothetical protein